MSWFSNDEFMHKQSHGKIHRASGKYNFFVSPNFPKCKIFPWVNENCFEYSSNNSFQYIIINIKQYIIKFITTGNLKNKENLKFGEVPVIWECLR